MTTVEDGVVRVALGVPRNDGWYDAHPGELEFRSRRLVGLWVGARPSRSGHAPLTVGFICFPGLTGDAVRAAGPFSAVGLVRWRAASWVYISGELAGETDLGEVTIDAEWMDSD
ncbi:MAG TPA: hypothetical protein VM597_06035 [Gemmataceae bacterium]|jgi:hypothetical protein|nr:hypothetical protein [Gemmataceae bacterium]